MSEMVGAVIRASLRKDWLDALDAVEDLRRELGRKSPSRLNMNEDQYAVVTGAAKVAYDALFAGRVVLDGNA
jgi:hypothetical protein